MNIEIREIAPNEYGELENFLYEAIYIPDNVPKPPRKIIGACWARIMNDYGHIDDETPSLALSVLKNFRRRGIATTLLEKILAQLSKKNFKRVSLSVQKENSPAVNLYRKMHVEIIGERDGEYLMTKTLLLPDDFGNDNRGGSRNV